MVRAALRERRVRVVLGEMAGQEEESVKEWEGVIGGRRVHVTTNGRSIIVKVWSGGGWGTLSPGWVSERDIVAAVLHTLLDERQPPTEVDHLEKAQEALNALAEERKQARLDRSTAGARVGLIVAGHSVACAEFGATSFGCEGCGTKGAMKLFPTWPSPSRSLAAAGLAGGFAQGVAEGSDPALVAGSEAWYGVYQRLKMARRRQHEPVSKAMIAQALTWATTRAGWASSAALETGRMPSPAQPSARRP